MPDQGFWVRGVWHPAKTPDGWECRLSGESLPWVVYHVTTPYTFTARFEHKEDALAFAASSRHSLARVERPAGRRHGLSSLGHRRPSLPLSHARGI